MLPPPFLAVLGPATDSINARALRCGGLLLRHRTPLQVHPRLNTSALLLFAQEGCLRCRQARNGNAEWAAADVVQAQAVHKGHTHGLTTLCETNQYKSQLHSWAHRSVRNKSQSAQLAHAR